MTQTSPTLIPEETSLRQVEILLVEDEPGDAYLTKEALRTGRNQNRVHVVEDGVEALAFLRRTGTYNTAPRPDLIFLDLNLPKMDGREVLANIKKDPQLVSIPVVVLTTSKADEDVLHSYALHANCYVTKPVDLEQFMSVIQATQDFWLSIVKLPPSSLQEV